MEVRFMILHAEVDVLIPGLSLLPMAAAISDASGLACWVNGPFVQLTGYPAVEIAGQKAALFASEEAWPALYGRLQRVFAAGEPWRGKSVGKWKNGNRCDIELTLTPIRAPGNSVSHVLWTIEDASRRNLATEELEQFREVVGTSEPVAQFGVFQWNAETGKSQWSPESYRLYGLDPDTTDPSFESWFQTVYIGDRERILREFQQTLESPDGRLNIEYRSADGIGWIAGKGQLYRDAEGRPDYMTGINIDITERKRVELALSQRADFAQRVFNSTDDHVAIVGSDGRILEVNDAWRRFARENQAGDEGHWGAGASYCSECPPEYGDSAIARAAFEGLRQVQLGCLSYFEIEYSCDSPKAQRWFVMRVLPFLERPGTVLVSHSNVTARRLVEQALRKGEERYRRVSSVISDLAYGYLATESGAYELDWLTGAAERLTGYSADELMAMRCWGSLVIDEDRALFGTQVVGLEPGSSGFCELRVRHKDGSIRWLASSAECVHSAGLPLRTFGGLVDITGRKLVEAALLESERLLRESQVIAGLGSYVLDLVTGVWRSSAVLDELFGFDESYERNFETWAALIHQEDREMMVAYFRDEVLGEGRRFDKEYRIVRRDTDEARWVHGYGRLEFDAGGRPLAMHGTIQDITDHRRVEEALRESEMRYRAIFESSRDALFIADGQTGMLVDANPAAQALTGRTLEELRTIHHTELYPPEDAALSQFRFEVDRREPALSSHFVLRLDGEKIPVEIVANRLYDSAGRELLLGAFRDITERMRAEEEREKLTSQLIHAQKMESVGRLAGGVAHDFNNLLTVINGHCQLLLVKLKTGDPTRVSVETILKAGERAEALTMQLLAFSRKQVLQPHVLDLNRVVGEMRSMLSRLLGEDVQVQVELNANHAFVNADPHQLQQVLMNLVVNARDAMPAGGRLVIETCDAEWDDPSFQTDAKAGAGRHVRLTVTDNGVGMDVETQRNIFEPFFTTKGIGKGTGLGLSMVHGIVAQSGGQIEVESAPGRGSSFHIYLPSVEGFKVAADLPIALESLGGTETVLVVEDQPEVLSYAVRVLRTFGYRVIEAQDADEAVSRFQENPDRIDLVLTDVVMPNGSGRELADALEILHPGIKVLFMSGYTEDVIVHHFAEDEDRHFIQKPFSPEELAAKVSMALGR